MEEKTPLSRRLKSIAKPLLFWLICAMILAVSSALAKGGRGINSMLLTASVATIGSFLLTIVFARWGHMPLKSTGV